jgi:MSHA biogenesis protein MshJ
MSGIDLTGGLAEGRAKFDALLWRERLLIGLTLISLVWMVWTYALQDYLVKERNQIIAGITGGNAQISAAVQEQRLLSGGDLQDPDLVLNQQKAQLLADLHQLDLELRNSIERFVAPSKMPELLAELMQQHQGLTFKRVTRLPTEPLAASLLHQGTVAQEASVDEEIVATSEPSVYRHPIELEFEGSYFDVLAYLTTLENSNWRLNWRSFDYQVKTHPIARVTVQVDTLSRRKEWLGV